MNGNKRESNSSVFARALCAFARADSRIVAITAAMPQGTGLDRFASEFPDRFFDVGIAEEHAVTMAAGMAAAGARPVVAIYSTFLQRAYDEILHDVCLQGLPVVFAVDRAGLVGEDGETHQGVYDIAFLRTLPGMTLLSPASQEELSEMLQLALMQSGPVAIRYNRGALPSHPLTKPVKVGEWEEVLHFAEKQLVVIATGRLLSAALKASDGLPVGLVNARSIKPMDDTMLARIAEHGAPVITVEDGIVAGGFGEAVQAAIGHVVRVSPCGVGEAPVRHASVAEQDAVSGISADEIRKNNDLFGACEMKGTRADIRLVELGLAESREKARSLIMSGAVSLSGMRVDKPGDNVPPDCVLAIKENPVPFVSRGGLKLDKPVRKFGLCLAGTVALDIGASTGGFTDCMLQTARARFMRLMSDMASWIGVCATMHALL